MKIMLLLLALWLPCSVPAAGAPLAGASAATKLLLFSADARGYTYLVEDPALAGAVAALDRARADYEDAQKTVASVFRSSTAARLRAVGPAVLRDAQRRYDAFLAARSARDREAARAAALLNFRRAGDVVFEPAGARVRVFVPRGRSLIENGLAGR